jgi:hypothetical protein
MTNQLQPDPNPSVRGTDPRIRIRTKMSRIRNTDSNPDCFTKLSSPHGGQQMCTATFSVVDPGCLSRIRIFPSRIQGQKDPGFASKNPIILTQKIIS